MSRFESEFASVWDDGVEVVCNCVVDLDQMEIIEMGEDRWLAGESDGYDLDTVDDEVENLIEEYVYIEETGLSYSAAPEGENVEDIHGNGIVHYEIF